MKNFIEALTRELHGWHDDTNWLSYGDVAAMVERAAAAAIGEDEEQSDISLRHEYAPEDIAVAWTVITVIDEFRAILLPGDVANLRAQLLTWDENKPAEVGDPLILPAIILGGLKVDHVTEEMLRGK